MIITRAGERLQKTAYGFYVGWGGVVLLGVLLMIEGALLGSLASHPLMRWLLIALGFLVVAMWCLSGVASIVTRDLRLAVLWGGTLVFVAAMAFVPFLLLWSSLVYGVTCYAVAIRWFVSVRPHKIEHVRWTRSL